MKLERSTLPRLLTSKLVAPTLPGGMIARPRLAEHLAEGERITAVFAPPGYGKTVAVRQWLAPRDAAVAWFDLDLLDDSPPSFWLHLIRSLRTVLPGLDDEPELLLAERGPRDPLFITALMAEVEATGQEVSIVLDGVSWVTDRAVFDGVALLVDRIGHLVRFIVIGRSEPALPTARWRSIGWLSETREEHLRFTDEEALAVAATFTDLDLTPDAVIALNRRTEGWPAGLQLALLSLRDAPDPDLGARKVAGSDRLFADYLVSDVLERLSPFERDVALALSVLEWFDADVCRDLVGIDAVPVAHELQRRRLFLTVIDDHEGAMRFHSLFRELLETELRWRDPGRRIELHRRAASLWIERGDLNAAYRHLFKIGDEEAASNLVVRPALELVDRGDPSGLAHRMRSLPRDLKVDNPSLALDLSLGWFFAGDDREAENWCDRAALMMSDGDTSTLLRVHSTRCMLALMRGDLTGASEHVEVVEGLTAATITTGHLEARFATIAARVTLAAGRYHDARPWVERAAQITDPDSVRLVIVPALAAWLELALGDLARATTVAESASATAEEFGMRPHHGTFDALVIAAWCHLGAGDLAAAQARAEQARIDADMLGFAWNRVRAGVLVAEIRRLTTGGRASLEAVRALRHETAAIEPGDLVDELHLVEARSLLACDEDDDAQRVIDRLVDSPRKQLLLGRMAAKRGSRRATEQLLADRAAWPVVEGLEADVLVSVVAPGSRAETQLTAAVERGAASGWVSPFLGHAPHVVALLDRLPLDRLHPALAGALRPERTATGARSGFAVSEPLTARELTIISLLPTHLSYAQIGEQLYLSINTVKGNLKTIYRKLGVSARADAVEVAKRGGLV